MKKLIIIAVGLMFVFQGCYDEYKSDFEYTSTYFALQKPQRVVVEEEGKDVSLEVGVMLGGKYNNDKDEVVYYQLDPSLLSEYPNMELLPSDYYSLSNSSEILIEKGSFLGKLVITLNDNFLNDTKAASLHYALPLAITSSTADTVISGKSTSIVAIQYQNKYYGAYWVKGTDNKLDGSGNVVDSNVYSDDDLSQNNFTVFETVARNVSIINYVGSDISGDNKLKVTFNDDGSAVVTSATEGSVSSVSGSGQYNKEDRILTLEYTYIRNGENHSVKDDLYYFAMPMEVKEW